MTQPSGFICPKGPGKVCKLQKAIYGPQPASRSWNLRFNKSIKEFVFVRSEEEPCVYMKFCGSSRAFIVLYVDDMLVIGNNKTMLESVR